MGNSSSTPSHSSNDYELVIKTSKELEYFLELKFKANGKGLHEKINSLPQDSLPMPLIKKMRYLATIRNKLIHERGFGKYENGNSWGWEQTTWRESFL